MKKLAVAWCSSFQLTNYNEHNNTSKLKYKHKVFNTIASFLRFIIYHSYLLIFFSVGRTKKWFWLKFKVLFWEQAPLIESSRRKTFLKRDGKGFSEGLEKIEVYNRKHFKIPGHSRFHGPDKGGLRNLKCPETLNVY